MIDFRFNYPSVGCQEEIINEEMMSPLSLWGNDWEHDINLRCAASNWLSIRNSRVCPDRITSVNGGTNALYVIAVTTKLCGATVVVDPLTYNGFLRLASLLQINLVSCPIDEFGFIPEMLRSICKKTQIKAMYLIPTIHNPLAFRMPGKRRNCILDIAREFDVLIIEDDAYEFLAEDKPGRFMHIAPERTFSVCSLTKIIDPIARIAFLVTPSEWKASISEMSKITSGGPSRMLECLALKWMENGTINLVSCRKRELAEKRLLLVRDVFSDFQYNWQRGGFHIWLPLNDRSDISTMVQKVRQAGVDILSSLDYRVEQKCTIKGFRIAFGNVRSEDQLIRGLSIVRDVINS